MEQSIETLVITQARFGSTRLPGKVLMKVNGEELLKIHLERISQSKKDIKIVVATTTNEIDDLIESKVKEWGYSVFRGDENDVLDRFYQACQEYNPKWVARLTSDCPLVDATLIDAVIELAQENDMDYCSNGLTEQYPDGQDVEVMKFSSLKKAWNEAKLKSEREHVTPFIINNTDYKGGSLFKAMHYPCEFDLGSIRMTVDEENDFVLIKKLIEELGTSKTWLEYTNYIIKNNLGTINSNIARNEGYLKSLKND